MNLRIQTARRRLKNHNLSWEDVESAARKILTATSEHLGVDRRWTFNYHYFAPRAKSTVVLRAKHRKLPHAVAVKYLHQAEMGPASTVQSEFAMLAELHARLDPQHRSIVASPFASTRQGYACEWVQLPRMKTVLLANAFSAARRQRCIEAAATNLRLMHDALGVRSRPLDTDTQIRLLENSGGTSQAWISAAEKFADLSHELAGQRVAHSPVHADFTPGNILLGRKRCVIFDFERNMETGPIYSDMTYFLVYVIAYCTIGTSRTLQGRIDEDVQTFMGAYGTDKTHDRKVIYYTYLAHVLKRWGRHEAKSLRASRNFHHRAYDGFAARRLEQICAEVMRHCF
ncbi:MAG: phosphotransferase [Pseudomonadota bacterium]